jgi:hypothetical protein
VDEERRKQIEEEERYRAEVRAKLEREKGTSLVSGAFGSRASEPSPQPLRSDPAPSAKPQKRRGGCLRAIVVVILGIVALAILANIVNPEVPEGTRRNPGPQQDEQAAAPAPSSASERTISFTSDPPLANIYIDGQEEPIDRTPASLSLSPGEHTYRIAFDNLDERSDRFRPYTGTITVTGDDNVSVWLDRFPPDEVETRKTIRLVEQQSEANLNGQALRANGEQIDSTTASILCKDHIRSRLKAPRSAKFAGIFSGEYQEPTLNGNIWTQIVTVDAENSFGAMLRSQWRCVINATDDTITASEL